MTDHRRYTKRRLLRELAYAKGAYDTLLYIEQDFDMSGELESEIDKYRNRIDELEDKIKRLPHDPIDDE